MNRRIEIAQNIVAELLNYLVLCSVVHLLVTDFFRMEACLVELLVLTAVPLFFYGMREWCKELWLFLVLHILPVIGVLALYRGSLMVKILLTGVVILYAVLSISKRVHSVKRGMEAILPPVAAGIYLVLYLLDGSQGYGENGAVFLQMMICYAAGYFLYYFLRQFLSYIDVNTRTTDNIPIKNVFASSAALAAGFTAAAFCIVTVCANRELMDSFGSLLRKGIRKLLSYIRIGSGEIEVETEPVIESGGGGGFFEAMGEAEPSLLVEILDGVLSIAAILLVLFLLGSLAVGLVKLIKTGFNKKGYQRQIVETQYVDQVERIGQKEEEGKRQKSSFMEKWKQAASPEEKIRRIYKKTIWKNVPEWEGEKREAFLKQATARECCLELFSQEKEAAFAFVSLYEKARYGKGLCGQEDVRRARELSEKLHRN